jgi:transposase-like protein
LYLWPAVDDEGEALDILVQARRYKDAASRLMRTLLKNQLIVPTGVHHSGSHWREKNVGSKCGANCTRTGDECTLAGIAHDQDRQLQFAADSTTRRRECG